MLSYLSVESTLKLLSSVAFKGNYTLWDWIFWRFEKVSCLSAGWTTHIENKLQLPFLSRCALTFLDGKVSRWKYLNLSYYFGLSCSSAISLNPKQLPYLVNDSQGYRRWTTLLWLQGSTRVSEYGLHWQPSSSSQDIQAAKKHRKRQQNCAIVKGSGKNCPGESFEILK